MPMAVTCSSSLTSAVPTQNQSRSQARGGCFFIAGTDACERWGLAPSPASLWAVPARLATNYRAVLADGRDPIDARRAELARESGKSFGDVATSLYEGKKSGWKNEKVTKQWLTTLQRYTMAIWSKPVASVGIDDVLAILQPIWRGEVQMELSAEACIEARYRCCPRVRPHSPRQSQSGSLARTPESLVFPSASDYSVVTMPLCPMPNRRLHGRVARATSNRGIVP